MDKLRLLILSAGSGGYFTYAGIASKMKDKHEIVGVVEPDDAKRQRVVETYDISKEYAFKTQKELLDKKGKIADVAVIATPDDLHVEPAIAFAKKECDILLEKPVARTSEDVTRMMQVDNYPFAFNKRLFFKNPSLSLSIAFSIETKSFKKAHTS